MSVEDLLHGFAELDEAYDDYVRAASYARGEIPERFASDRIRQLIEASGEGYKFRFAKIPVDVLADRVQIANITADSEAVDAAIETIRQANDMEKQEPHLTHETFMYGDTYLLVWPIEPEDVEAAPGQAPTDAAMAIVGVELTYQSPLSTRAIYDSEDGRRMLYVIRRWKAPGATPDTHVWRVELWYADRIEPWISREGSKGRDATEWLPYAEDGAGNPVPATPDAWPLPHDWEEIPIKHARTSLPYGTPEHIDAYGPQDAITKAIITQLSALESFGWAERYRIMDDASILDTARDAVAWTDDADAPVAGSTAVEVSGLRRGPGTETKYHGTKSVGTFPAPDIGQLIEPIEQWVRFMATVTKTPLYEFDPRDSGQMSGIARLRADAPLRDKEKDRKLYLLGFWREVWDLALRMVGIDAELINIQWKPPEVISDPEWWAVAETRLRLGVPIRQILAEANYLPEQIDAWLDAQAEESTLDAKIDRMQRLGEALQAIGAAQAMAADTIDPVRVEGMISRILGEAS